MKTSSVGLRARGSGRCAGFTLVELLVSMAVVGILLAALVSLTSSLLGFSARSSTVSANLTDLSDVLGYVSLNARDARDVWDGASVVDSASGSPFSCTLSDGCLALLVPVTSRQPATDGVVLDHELVVFRVMLVGNWLTDLGDPPELAPLRSGWQDESTPVLVEYRSTSACAGVGSGLACGEPPEPPSLGSVQVGDPRLVVHGIVDPPSGGAVFELSGNIVSIRVQTRESVRGTTYTVPRDDSLVSEVYLR